MSKIPIPSCSNKAPIPKLPRTPFGEAIKAPTAVDKGCFNCSLCWQMGEFILQRSGIKSGDRLLLVWDVRLGGELNSLLLAFPCSPRMASMARCC
ncbi:hypothetical protein CEXT_687701 [Caerostris extrusa]|uniref:Uncharacterized protein n=1 Tax=Caerostris extrusa TaxID=172846 RepID=A0AAV4MXD5_CAEEX|nr:hypothetical protein CEXT_687701 [Caerostris extrusa]